MLVISLAEKRQFFVSTGQTACAQSSVVQCLQCHFRYGSLLEYDLFNSRKCAFR